MIHFWLARCCHLTFNYIVIHPRPWTWKKSSGNWASEEKKKSFKFEFAHKKNSTLCIRVRTIACVYNSLSHLRYTSTMAKEKKELNQQKLLRTSIVFFLFLFLFSSFFHAILIMWIIWYARFAFLVLRAL